MSRKTSLKKGESVPLRTWGEDEEEGDVFMHSDDDFQNLAHKLKKDSKKYDPLKGNVVPIVNSDSSGGAATSLIR